LIVKGWEGGNIRVLQRNYTGTKGREEKINIDGIAARID